MTKTKISSNVKKLVIMLLITFGLLIVFRLGAFITLPYIHSDILEQAAGQIDFGFLDVFTGGALSSYSVLCLGISPYITSSIVVQLLQMDILPRFKELAEEGEEGKQKLNQYTRYIALGLAFVQSLTLVIGIHANYHGGLFVANDFLDEFPVFVYIYVSLVATAGTAFCLWLSEIITSKGFGNGSSMLIVAGILATFPQMFAELIQQLITAEETKNILVFVITMLMFIAVIVFIVFMEAAQRKIPIQYANRPAAASFRGRSDSNIPIKLNSASVIPVIFASTLMSLPATIIQITQVNTTSGIGKWLSQIFLTTSTDATTGNVTINVMGFLLYIMLIVVFSFFYSFLQLNPEKMSENLQKQNAYVPGVRPGEETTGYISRVLFKMTVVGATYLTIVAILPIVMTVIFDLPASAQIGGTSLIIVVGVAIESWKQLKQAKQEKQYRGFID